MGGVTTRRRTASADEHRALRSMTVGQWRALGQSLIAKGRFRPCVKCGGSPDIHNTNRGADFIGHEYA